MREYQYYGLFLTQGSRDKLRRYLIDSPYQLAFLRSTKEYLDHCTLLHMSQEKDHVDLKKLLDKLCINTTKHALVVNAVSMSDGELKFIPLCANRTPHITICTFGDGKPQDSNNITKWTEIEPMCITTLIHKV